MIEVHILVYKPDREDNTFYLKISFKRDEETVLPHRVEPSTLTIIYSWPNPFYQENPERAAHTPSWVSVALDNTFAKEDPSTSNSLVPSDIPPEYPSLSPRPPHLSPEPELLVPLFTQAPSSSLSVQEILH